VEWIKQSFNIPTFSSTLEVKGADAVISSISITEDRGKYFSFTRSYFRTSLAAAILKEFKDFAKRFDRRLEKAIVGVMKGTTGQKWVRNNLGPQRVNTYDSPDRLARALKNRDVEVIFLDRAILDYLLSHHSYRFLIAREGLEHENYGIALSKGNQELLSELNAGLEKLDESGVYDEIYNKWFGPSRSLP
jgi:glutamine transport system substrate-binding protein